MSCLFSDEDPIFNSKDIDVIKDLLNSYFGDTKKDTDQRVKKCFASELLQSTIKPNCPLSINRMYGIHLATKAVDQMVIDYIGGKMKFILFILFIMIILLIFYRNWFVYLIVLGLCIYLYFYVRNIKQKQIFANLDESKITAILQNLKNMDDQLKTQICT